MKNTLLMQNSSHKQWKLQPDLIFKGGFLFVLLMMILQVGSYFITQNAFYLTLIFDILTPLSDLATIMAMIYAMRWSRLIDETLSNAWAFMAMAVFSLLVGDVIWAYYELVIGEVPSPFGGDVFYLISYPLFLIGILRIPHHKEALTEEVGLWLDIFIVFFSAFGLYWNFLIGPSLLDNNQNCLMILVNSAYPVGDMLLIMAVFLNIFLPRSPSWRKPMILMLVGHALIAIADSIFNYQTINEIYVSSAFFNILFSLGPLFLMLSGLSQATVAYKITRESNTTPVKPRSKFLTIARLVIPFFWLLFSYTMLNFGSGSKQALQPNQLLAWIDIIIVLLILRQLLAILENNRLSNELRSINNELENRVLERSSELRSANAELQLEMEERKRIEMTLREREEKFAHLALHDPLTNLPNRALLSDRISQAIHHFHRTGERFAILFLDLDSFKFVNDSLGHVLGDELLIQMSQRLKMLIRAEDSIARLGGDEFVILFEGIGEERFVLSMAERVLSLINEPFILNSQTIYITVSVGIVISSQEYSLSVDVIRDADLAMYKAKSTGKNRFVVFTPNLRNDAVDRVMLGADLRQAFSQNQLVLQYEPIIALKTNQLMGFEALIRWQHPTRGLIGPSEFIPLAESIGLIDSITQWTLQEACRQIHEWLESFPIGPSFSVSVNISPYSLRHPDLLGWVDDALKKNCLSPAFLTLEIVESTLIQDADLAKRVFTRLREIGVRVNLDDFGVGYSSLGYINEYPIDALKIDRSFISRSTEGNKVSALVHGIVSLAEDLGLDVIAEGIEKEDQAELMRKIGCSYGQGFLFSKAIDAKAVECQYLVKLSSDSRPIAVQPDVIDI